MFVAAPDCLAHMCPDTKRFTKLLDSLLDISGLKSGNATQESIPQSVQVESYRRLAPVIVQEDAAQLCEVAGTLLLRGNDPLLLPIRVHC